MSPEVFQIASRQKVIRFDRLIVIEVIDGCRRPWCHC